MAGHFPVLNRGLLFAEKLGQSCVMRNRGRPGEPDFARFARLVKARRDSLGLTQEQVNLLGGPSNTTFTKIEGLVWRPGRPGTLQKLDAGLQWEPGSSARILYDGGEPIPFDRDRLPSALASDERAAVDIAVELTVLIETAVQGLWAAMGDLPPGLPPAAGRALHELDDVVMMAERLALQLAGTGEEYAIKRREARAKVRAKVETEVSAVKVSETTACDDESFEMLPAVEGDRDIAAADEAGIEDD